MSDQYNGNELIDETHPPTHDWHGLVFKWERGLDPWHEDAFPDEFKKTIHEMNIVVGLPEKRREGWHGLDKWENVIIFVPDTVVK